MITAALVKLDLTSFMKISESGDSFFFCTFCYNIFRLFHPLQRHAHRKYSIMREHYSNDVLSYCPTETGTRGGVHGVSSHASRLVGVN